MSLSLRRLPSPVLALALLMMVTAVALLAAPAPARADDYSVDQVDGEIYIYPDGSLQVVETRTFDFDGSYNGVYWDLSTEGPKERSSDAPIQLTVNSVEDLTRGGGKFTQDVSGSTGTYQLIPQGDNMTRVKIFSPHDDERAQVRISYTLTNVVNAWADTAELYWKLVSSGWEVSSNNVTYQVYFPAPSDQMGSVDDYVRAWGHGPLDGNVAVDGVTVTYTIPHVKSGESAEARITLPLAWVPNVAPSAAPKLDAILSEEKAWADEANTKRERQRQFRQALDALTIGALVAEIIVPVVLFIRYKRLHKPHFSDTYFRDVPSSDHPAVLGCLFDDGATSGKLFTATLMKLTDDGVIELDRVRDGRGRDTDYSLTERGGRSAGDPIGKAAMDLLFGLVAKKGKAASSDASTIYFSDIKEVAKEEQQEYADALENWQSEVTGGCEARGFFVDERRSLVGLAVAVFTFASLVAIGAWAFTLINGDEERFVRSIVMLVVVIIVGILGGLLTSRMKELSREAIELRAKLKALKKWLHDFTLLKEAVPKDVVLWNRLLVMAVVLDEAKRVIEQLRTAMPEVLDDPDFAVGYYWYAGSSTMDSPADAFDSTYDSAYSDSVGSLSSSDGDSGGFSSGGGGGGGDGGGGAF